MRFAPIFLVVLSGCLGPNASLARKTPVASNERIRPWEKASTNGAPHYAEAREAIRSLSESYPGLVTSSAYGTSVKGRPLTALRISQGKAVGKPAMVLAGGIHGMEFSEKDALFMAATLLQRANEPLERRLLSERVLWVIPMINPDGVHAHLRANANRTDLNRNFAGTWIGGGLPGDYYYPGPSPFSEPESQALRDFLLSRENLKVYADLHRSTWLVLVPYIGGGPDREVTSELTRFAKTLDDAMGNPSSIEIPFRIPGQGGFTVDWVWDTLGVMSVTFEFAPDRLDPMPRPEEDPRYLALLHLLQNCGTYPVRGELASGAK